MIMLCDQLKFIAMHDAFSVRRKCANKFHFNTKNRKEIAKKQFVNKTEMLRVH